MIYIKEEKTKQVPGLTSLFVSFDYNKDIVEVVKSCDGSKYNKKDKIWEVPILNLSYLLDMLVLIDDVTLQLLEDEDDTEHFCGLIRSDASSEWVKELCDKLCKSH